MPETTPMPNETAKILVQNRASRGGGWPRGPIQRTSSCAMKADSPMVKLGKMMWNVTVKANWRRASRTGSKSIGHAPTIRENRGGLHDRSDARHRQDHRRDCCRIFYAGLRAGLAGRWTNGGGT